eukprot:1801097-Lingulodinium_polyedra.AAC.1
MCPAGGAPPGTCAWQHFLSSAVLVASRRVGVGARALCELLLAHGRSGGSVARRCASSARHV